MSRHSDFVFELTSDFGAKFPRDVEKRLCFGEFAGDVNNPTTVGDGAITLFPAPHSLPLISALANTFGGMVKPICLAALRLIIKSNFFGGSIGKSPGLAPFNILSTYVAARRNRSR